MVIEMKIVTILMSAALCAVSAMPSATDAPRMFDDKPAMMIYCHKALGGGSTLSAGEAVMMSTEDSLSGSMGEGSMAHWLRVSLAGLAILGILCATETWFREEGGPGYSPPSDDRPATGS